VEKNDNRIGGLIHKYMTRRVEHAITPEILLYSSDSIALLGYTIDSMTYALMLQVVENSPNLDNEDETLP
jgi:hypothetical protein